jgi:hypothetical protein
MSTFATREDQSGSLWARIATEPNLPKTQDGFQRDRYGKSPTITPHVFLSGFFTEKLQHAHHTKFQQHIQAQVVELGVESWQPSTKAYELDSGR